MSGAADGSGLPGCPTPDRPTADSYVAISRGISEAVEVALSAMEGRGVMITNGAMVATLTFVTCRYCHERGAMHVVGVFQIDTPVGRFFAQSPDRIQHYGARPPDPLPAPGAPSRARGHG